MQSINSKLQRELKAPVFSVKDIFDRQINLETYRDKKILIGFFRHVGCPFCNIRVHKLLKVYNELHPKGLEMIFFFESTEKVLLQSSFHQEVSPIPLIADPEKKWYASYGLEESLYKSTMSHIATFAQTAFDAVSKGLPTHMMASGESFSTMPAEFLIAEDLTIKDVYYSERLTDRLDVRKIKEFVEAEQLAYQ
ncbi:redoxin domain-containing protein [Cytophagaceae bacterium YF14B1]|uniref:Redoxin domain-containing protein n=1 Tax=Xanthocytophaga flava TaxID=3048013 RepID=A0AAE3U6V4_9BACT|nr:redoxin domain-containing protein [Xanthocytophaga flavus]MDJ1480962.1 redoxin domain-containing protein [Xanthocytophaga flavus]